MLRRCCFPCPCPPGQCLVRVLFDATWSNDKIANTVAVAAEVAGMEEEGGRRDARERADRKRSKGLERERIGLHEDN